MCAKVQVGWAVARHGRQPTRTARTTPEPRGHAGVDYLDLERTPEPVAPATQALAENAAHPARLCSGPTLMARQRAARSPGAAVQPAARPAAAAPSRWPPRPGPGR